MTDRHRDFEQPAECFAIGDLATLLDDGARLRLLVESGIPVRKSTCNYIRVKPEVGALVGLELECEGPNGVIALSGYVRTQSAERTRELVEKWNPERATSTAIGDGVRMLAGGHSVLFLFPNDARVRGMRFIADVDKLKRLLLELPGIGGDAWRIRGRKTHIETVRYKPERRLILRARLGMMNDRTGEKKEQDVFVRFFTDDRGAEIARIRAALAKGPIDRHLPMMHGAIDDGRLFVEAAVDGTPMLAEVTAGRGDAEATAEVLTLLHGTPIEDVAALDCDAVADTAHESLANLVRAEPDLERIAAPIRNRLAELRPSSWSVRTLHGDCHMHQFLHTPNGPVIVDFERMCQGDPGVDLGHLCAHLLILESRDPSAAPHVREFRESVLRQYIERNPTLDMAALPFFIGCGLIERALLPYRRAQQDWVAASTALLELTARAIGARPAACFDPDGDWKIAYPRHDDRWPAIVGKEHGYYHRAADEFVALAPTADPRLPGLRDWVERGTLISYRCGRRATVRTEDDHFVKIVRPKRAATLVNRYQFARQLAARGSPMPSVPVVLTVDRDAGYIEFERLHGSSLHEALRSDEIPVFSTVAKGLSALHTCTADQKQLPPTNEHAPLREWAGFVADHDPELHALVVAAVDACSDLRVGTGGPTDRVVHGDLHDKNIVITDDGIGLIDLDQLGIGAPVIDLGNLAAHFVLRALQNSGDADQGRAQVAQFLADYRGHGGEYDAGELVAVGARTLLRLACLYRFRHRWLHLPPDLLRACHHWIEVGL